MKQGKAIPESIRRQILRLSHSGLSPKLTAVTLQVSKTTVRRVVRASKPSGA